MDMLLKGVHIVAVANNMPAMPIDAFSYRQAVNQVHELARKEGVQFDCWLEGRLLAKVAPGAEEISVWALKKGLL